MIVPQLSSNVAPKTIAALIIAGITAASSQTTKTATAANGGVGETYVAVPSAVAPRCTRQRR
jgi:hypothetical protein